MSETQDALEAAEKAAAMAERYVETLERISHVLNDEALTDSVKVLRVRMELVKLDRPDA